MTARRPRLESAAITARFALAVLSTTAAWPQEPPLIRVTTRVVEVNAIVRDKSGPVRGLSKADFTLLDQHRPREIRSFSVNSPTAGTSVADQLPALPAGFHSNEPERRGIQPANATIVLLDGLNTPLSDQINARQQFLKFLSQIRPTDRLAVYTLGRSLQVLSDFSNDGSRLSAALAPYRGRNEFPTGADAPAHFETKDEKLNQVWNNFLDHEQLAESDRRVDITMAALEAIAGRMAHVPGRKNLIWVSAAFPFAVHGNDPKIYAREINRGARALNAANIAIYPVDARGLVGLPAFAASQSSAPAMGPRIFTPLGLDTMDIFAQATGGRAYKNSNDTQGSIRAVLDDSEFSYTLTFAAEDVVMDGSFHEIKLKVNRPGVEVRCREGYIASLDRNPPPAERTEFVRRALASPIESAAIRIRARLDHGAAPAFTIILDPADISFDESGNKWLAELDAIVSQRAASGRELAQATYLLRPATSREQFPNVQAKGLGFSKPLTLEKDVVDLRIVIFDRKSGRIGSLILPVQ